MAPPFQGFLLPVKSLGGFTAKTGWEATRSVNVWCSVASLATVLPHPWRHRANLLGLFLLQVASLGTAGMCQSVIHLRMVLLPRRLRKWVPVRSTRHIRTGTPVVSSHWKSLRYTTRKTRAGLPLTARCTTSQHFWTSILLVRRPSSSMEARMGLTFSMQSTLQKCWRILSPWPRLQRADPLKYAGRPLLKLTCLEHNHVLLQMCHAPYSIFFSSFLESLPNESL